MINKIQFLTKNIIIKTSRGIAKVCVENIIYADIEKKI